jgi:hypothetical protein
MVAFQIANRILISPETLLKHDGIQVTIFAQWRGLFTLSSEGQPAGFRPCKAQTPQAKSLCHF